MARTVTIAQIMTRARERADIEGTDGAAFIDDAELQKLVDAAYTELVDLLVKHEIHQFETTENITTAAGTATYALPADHYKTLGMDHLWSAGKYVAIPELTFAERNIYADNITDSYGSRAAGYRIVGNNIVFIPTPTGVQTYRHSYVPAPANISALATSTAIDGIAGWDELLVIMVAINCRIKEEQSTTDLREREQKMLQRIAESACLRGQVQGIVDTSNDWGIDGRSRRSDRWR